MTPPRLVEAADEFGRLVLLTASNGVDLDISFAAFPFELAKPELLDPFEAAIRKPGRLP
jgi:hypothetical protein